MTDLRVARILTVSFLIGATLLLAPGAAEAHPHPTVDTPRPKVVVPEVPIREITFPIVGPVTFSDTWGACRGSRCSRSHAGVDIFGHKLAPLVAATDGTIVSVRRTAATSAGNKVVIEDDAGWRYYYFHLNNDAPGTDDGSNPQAWILPNRLRLGDRVSAGDVIGYLGDSGNAESTPAHLHFEIHPPRSKAINPTPSVQQARDAGRLVPVAPLASTPDGRAEHEPVIVAWYRALLHREPTRTESFAWADRFDIDFADRADLIADLTMAPQRIRPAGTVVRAFQVAHDRRPSINELRSWETSYRSGADAEGIVAGLLDSAEFVDRHGSLNDAAFIDVVYTNARGRRPSEPVRTYWLKQLDTGRARADMAEYFVESYGLKNAMWHDLEVLQAFRAALDRLPSQGEFDRWVGHLDRGGLIVDIVAEIKN